MTKNKARAIDKSLNVQCDEPYLFAVKVGSGCLVSSKCHGNGYELFTLLVNIIDNVMQNLQRNHHSQFVEILCLKLLQYLVGDSPAVQHDNLSGKQLAKRIKHNDSILNALEVVL